MTQEEKQLLLKGLSARLPYGVRVKQGDWEHTLESANMHNGSFDSSCAIPIPYLRPMSSMTEEERGQYMEFIEWSHNDYDGATITCINKERLHEYLDFIYSHHFDDNGLIEKGLALEAQEGMYE